MDDNADMGAVRLLSNWHVLVGQHIRTSGTTPISPTFQERFHERINACKAWCETKSKPQNVVIVCAPCPPIGWAHSVTTTATVVDGVYDNWEPMPKMGKCFLDVAYSDTALFMGVNSDQLLWHGTVTELHDEIARHLRNGDILFYVCTSPINHITRYRLMELENKNAIISGSPFALYKVISCVPLAAMHRTEKGDCGALLVAKVWINNAQMEEGEEKERRYKYIPVGIHFAEKKTEKLGSGEKVHTCLSMSMVRVLSYLQSSQIKQRVFRLYHPKFSRNGGDFVDRSPVGAEYNPEGK